MSHRNSSVRQTSKVAASPKVLPKVNAGYSLCVAELAEWQSVIQRDASACSAARRYRQVPRSARVSFIAPNGDVRDSASLSLAIGESSADFFRELEASSLVQIRPKPRTRGSTSSEVLSTRKKEEGGAMISDPK